MKKAVLLNGLFFMAGVLLRTLGWGSVNDEFLGLAGSFIIGAAAAVLAIDRRLLYAEKALAEKSVAFERNRSDCTRKGRQENDSHGTH